MTMIGEVEGASYPAFTAAECSPDTERVALKRLAAYSLREKEKKEERKKNLWRTEKKSSVLPKTSFSSSGEKNDYLVHSDKTRRVCVYCKDEATNEYECPKSEGTLL